MGKMAETIEELTLALERLLLSRLLATMARQVKKAIDQLM